MLRSLTIRSLLFTGILLSVLISPSWAQYVQQGNKLVGTGAVGSAVQQGFSSAISADGKTAIVGAYQDDAGAGAVWIYTRSGDVWTQQGGKMVGTGASGTISGQGFSVALSADGNTAVVGGYQDGGLVGAVWVFTRSGGSWTQEGTKLVGTGYVGGPKQGSSVAISADGNTILIGAYGDDGGIGAAWVFRRSSGVWSQDGGKLVGTGAVGTPGEGISVALSADGNTAIVGGLLDNINQGAAWVYTRSGGVWTQQGGKLVGTGASGAAFQGYSVALSADGNTALSGGDFDNGNVGATWVFTRSGGVWTQQGSKLVGSGGSGSLQGTAVDLSSDGNTAVVGGLGDNGYQGAVWIFRRSGSTWSQLGSKITGTGGIGNPDHGSSVSISGDGNVFIEGAPGDNASFGAAWVFALPPSPTITAASDIGNDQGGQVRLAWDKAASDNSFSSPQVTSYSIFRKSSSGTMMAPKASRAPDGLAWDTTLLGYDYISDVPAFQLPSYQTVVSTLEDSSASGTHYFKFIVVARTADVNEYYASGADSGYSVDNLAPVPPAGIIAAAVPGPEVDLTWDAPVDPDVKYYKVYRSTSSGFTPDNGSYIGASSAPGYIDNGPVEGVANYYRVIAVDLHDNESTPSSEAAANVAVTIFYGYNAGWNMVSVPLVASDFSKTALYPTSISPALAYSGSYQIQPTLANGDGYWLKFGSAGFAPVTGLVLTDQVVNVNTGWNLIGALTASIPVSSVGSVPGGIVTSSFYSFNGSYQTATSLDPGAGYWIKCSQAGQLLLSSSGNVPASSRLRMELQGEEPPAPPTAQENGGAMPTDYSLAQNYPNPFNPATSISYGLPSSEHVRLAVYNMLGQEVALLVDEIQGPGYKQVTFDAAALPSGVYTYRITAGTFTEMRRMLLIR